MNQRDWDKELAKIDKQLASVSDEELLPKTPTAATGMPRGAGATAARPAPVVAASAPAASGKARLWSYTKLAVAATAAVGLWIWPWPARCGLPLVGLVGAAGGAAVLGLWSAVGTWRNRLGVAHLLSLLAVLSALVLGAREVLPRVGYAQPTFDRPASWACQVEAPNAASPNVTPNTTPDAGPPAPQGLPQGTLPGSASGTPSSRTL
jgi:hypothetical protein